MPEKEYDVIGIGVSALDVLSLVEDYYENEGVHEAFETELQGGGPVATALAALSNLGAKTAMIDTIGDDWRGDLILKGFRERNVDTKFIRTAKGSTSSITSILVKKSTGERLIYFTPGEASHYPVIEITPAIINSTNYIHMNGRHINSCLEACEYAKDTEIKISFDGGANRYRPELNDLIDKADIVIAAKNFVMEYSGEKKIESAVKKILKQNTELAVVTDGLNGSWVFPSDGESFHQSAFPLEETADTTGCGDCYHGAFLYGLVQKWDLRKTAEFASAAAALSSRKLGGRAGLPDLEVVELFLNEK